MEMVWKDEHDSSGRRGSEICAGVSIHLDIGETILQCGLSERSALFGFQRFFGKSFESSSRVTGRGDDGDTGTAFPTTFLLVPAPAPDGTALAQSR